MSLMVDRISYMLIILSLRWVAERSKGNATAHGFDTIKDALAFWRMRCLTTHGHINPATYETFDNPFEFVTEEDVDGLAYSTDTTNAPPPSTGPKNASVRFTSQASVPSSSASPSGYRDANNLASQFSNMSMNNKGKGKEDKKLLHYAVRVPKGVYVTSDR